MVEIYWRGGPGLKPLNFMETIKISRHKRSNSDPLKRKYGDDTLNNTLEASYHLKLKEMGQHKHSVEAKKRQPPNAEVQNSLKQEIVQLQERLNQEFVVRHALQKALSYRPFSHDTVTDKSIPKDAKELIRDIAVLEMEVVYLEHYLLSLYRKKFDQRVSSLPTMDERLKLATSTDEGMEGNDIWGAQKLLDSGIHRSHSSLSQRSACSIRTTPPLKSLAKAVDSYHSLPLSMLEQAQADAPNGISLAEHFGTSVSDYVPDTPNWISEVMIKCISDIYCELADPPLMNHECSFSPISYSSSLNMFYSRGQGDIWSPQCGRFSSFNSHFDNPFSIRESKEFSGPYSTMAKVERICRDDKKLKEIEHKLQYYRRLFNCRSLVYRLEKVDPRRMKHEEKLAFWINVHNALVMHAFLVYGIPKNNLKRVSLLLKAAYKVGGQTINVDMIQSSILGCRIPRPGQVIPLKDLSNTACLFGDARKAYAIEHPEPRLHFALCSGSYSDPVVHVYTPKRVFQDLETAKEEYIQSNFSINKEQKVLLPKMILSGRTFNYLNTRKLERSLSGYPTTSHSVFCYQKNWHSKTPPRPAAENLLYYKNYLYISLVC
ncbi:hypothetical protein Patl1_36314 [Pistacia atlantica]|nr:hypothetical protein Patl1_36314 [Pistacia atlantica]